jgi:hypothetical protein
MTAFRHAGSRGVWMAFEEPVGILGSALEALGARWIAPRAGDGSIYRSAGQVNTPVSPPYMKLYQDLGLAVYPWVYLRPSDASRDLSQLRRLVDLGASGVILDVETEFMGERDAAARLVDKAKAALPGTLVGYSSFDLPLYHPAFPWAEFSQLGAAFPQLYAFEHNDAGHAHWLAEYDRQWKAKDASDAAVAACPRYPVGACYRPRTRGGQVLAPYDAGKLAADIMAADARMTGGWYSIEALLAGPKEVYEAMTLKTGVCQPTVASKEEGP